MIPLPFNRIYLLLALSAASAAAGFAVARNHYGAEIADIKASHAIAQAEAERLALERLQGAQVRGDALAGRLRLTESKLSSTALELSHALKTATSDRPCLGVDAVRLLNGANDGLLGAMPPAAGIPDAADAAAATDTDVARWISGAIRQYETCRARLDALIDFNEGAQQ
jgi:hypothetical protein